MSKLRRGLRDVRLEHTLECTVGKGRFGGEKWSPRYAVYNPQVLQRKKGYDKASLWKGGGERSREKGGSGESLFVFRA